MGFFDKIKSAMNAVTGNAAKVTLEFQPSGTLMPGDQVQVKVSATSTGQQVKSKGCYIDLTGVENVVLKPKTAQVDSEISVSKTAFDQAFQIAPEFVLGANESKVFEGQFTVPAGVQPSFTGTFTNFEWQIRGRIEAVGNDPDSGFKPVRVGAR